MLNLGDWIFDPSTRRLCGRRGERKLSPKAAAVLQALAETRGQVWSRDALFERVWPNVTVTDEVLTHAVAELRRAMHDDFRSPSIIETIHKNGYRLLDGAVDGCAAQPTAPLDLEDADGGDPARTLRAYATCIEASERYELGGKKNLDSALCLFRSAVEDAPDYAPAHAGVAKVLVVMSQYHAPCVGALPRALDHCATARRLDQGFGEAVAVEALAHAMLGEETRAHSLFSTAIGLSPQSSEVHYLCGRACFAHLEPRLAAPMLERAAALRPEDYMSMELAGTASEMVGDRVRARANYTRALRRIELRLADRPDDYKAMSAKMHTLVQLDRPDDAEALLEDLNRHPDPVRHSPACALALAGDSEGALDVLELSIEEGWRYAAWLRRDPCLHSLRNLPRFRRIARSINA